MQVERVLRHDASSLLGANIEDIIVPSSRESIRGLIRDLIMAEQRAALSEFSVEDGEEVEDIGENDRVDEDQEDGGDGGGRDRANNDGNDRENNSASTTCIPTHQVSEHYSSEQSLFPPLLEVNVNAGQTSGEVAAGEDVSDSSGDPPGKKSSSQQKQQQEKVNNNSSEMSSLTHKNSCGVGGESGEDGTTAALPRQESSLSTGSTSSDIDKNSKKQASSPSTECDDSTSSENKANANLLKNVEMCKLNKDKEDDEQVRFSYKDDVMGAFVTANNADAKLSSLMHHPKKDEIWGSVAMNGSVEKNPSLMNSQEQEQLQNDSGKREEQSSSSADSSSVSKRKKRGGGNSSEDSGYRESNESPEESNEYPEDSSSSLGESSDRSSAKKKREFRLMCLFCQFRTSAWLTLS
jgi:hypothetical protein